MASKPATRGAKPDRGYSGSWYLHLGCLGDSEGYWGDTAGAFSIGLPSIRDDWRYMPLLAQYDVDCEAAALGMHFADLGKRPFLVGEERV